MYVAGEFAKLRSKIRDAYFDDFLATVSLRTTDYYILK